MFPCCPFSPHDVTVSRVPSPESRPRSIPRTCPQSHGPRLFTPRFPEPPRLTWHPHGLRRLLVPEDPSVTPPTAHAPAPRSPNCLLNRLRAVLATPVSAWLFGSFLRCTPGPRIPGYFPRCFAAVYNRLSATHDTAHQ